MHGPASLSHLRQILASQTVWDEELHTSCSGFKNLGMGQLPSASLFMLALESRYLGVAPECGKNADAALNCCSL